MMNALTAATCAIVLASAFAAAATAADTESDAAKAGVNALVGCWTGPGQVRGTPTDNDVEVKPRLDGKYVTVAVNSRDPKHPYRAVVVIGWASARKLTSFWMDSFGGEYSSTGSGLVAADGSLEITYPYPDADFVNTFTRHGDGLSWTITEKKHGGADRNFATYTLSHASCDGRHIEF